MRVICAIPNYNGASCLVNIIKQVVNDSFDEIYVLDDASTDNSLELLYAFKDQVIAVDGHKNLGPAGNRNRILEFLEPDDIVCFVDVDMEIKTPGIREKIEECFLNNDDVGIIGGMILNKKNKPMTYNYGRLDTKTAAFWGGWIERLAILLHFKPLVLPLRRIAKKYTYNVEIRYFKPVERPVDWVSEAFCALRGDVFKKIGGFDSNMRYSEGQDLALRFRELGHKVIFYPNILAKHLELKVRDQSRDRKSSRDYLRNKFK
ncbi:glycosyltransferase [Candidatus Saccharibacteria bacterium CPR2]|nr:glycosyltransferase [Candidatus Saccharibacteria bacterium CPR2]